MPPPNPDKNVKAFSIKIGELIIFYLGTHRKLQNTWTYLILSKWNG